MEYILQENAQKGLDEVLDETFSYLSDKYDHHRWYVVAYQRSTKVNDDFQSYNRDAKILFDPDFYRTNLGDDYAGGFSVAAIPLVPYDNPAMSSQATSLLQAICNNQLPWIDYSTDNVYKIYEQLTSYVNRYYRYVIIRPDAGAKIKRSEDLDIYKLPATNANKCKGWKDFVIATFPSKRPEDTLVPVQKLSIVNSKGEPLIVADGNKNLTAVQQLANETTSITLTVRASVESKTLWKFDGIQLKDEKGFCLDVMTNLRSIAFKNSFLTNIQNTVFLTSCNSQKFTQHWRREGTNIVGVYGCLSTSYHKKVDFDLDLQYPHLTPCSAISTESSQDWYFADNNLRTLWVNEVSRVNLKHWVLINGYNKALTVKDNRGTGRQWMHQRNYNKEEGQEWRLTSDGLLINRHKRCLMTNNKHWATQDNCNEGKYNIGLRWNYKNYKLRNAFGCLTVKDFDDGSWIFVSKCIRNQLGQMWFLSEDGVSRASTTRQNSKNVFNCQKTGHGEIKSINFVMKAKDRERVTLTGTVANNETRWYYENGRFHNGRCLCLFADVSQSVLVKPCDGFSLSEYWFFRGNQLWNTESVCLQREYFTAVKFRLKVAACNPKEVEQKWKIIS